MLLLSHSARAQNQPDVAEILKKVSETYKATTQYELVAEFKGRDERSGTPEAGHVVMAFRAPDRYRFEGGLPGTFADGTIVCDGSTVWFYQSQSKQYGSLPLSALTAEAPGDLWDASPEAVDSFIMSRYRGATDFAPGAKFLREEAIVYAGAKISCYVLSVPQRKDTYTWWIDSKRYWVLREDHAGASSVFTTIKLGEPIPDERFRFEPPPEAKKVEMNP